jgi:hypothetical protein
VAVIVEIPTLRLIAPGLNPTAACELNRADPREIEPIQISDRIETEFTLLACTSWRSSSRSQPDEATTDDASRAGKIRRGDGGLRARRRSEMSHLDVSGTHARQMLGPERRLHSIDETCQPIEATGLYGRRCRTKSDAVHDSAPRRSRS